MYIQRLRLLGIVLGTFILSGCASGAKVFNMIPADMEKFSKSHPYSVSVKTAGGRETESWAVSQISNDAFRGALIESLQKSGVFKEVIKQGDAEYVLDVFITKVQQPLLGFNMTVSVSASWKLIESKTHKVVFEELIITPYEVKMTEEWVGMERLRKANEGAVRENIRKGIIKLSQIDL